MYGSIPGFWIFQAETTITTTQRTQRMDLSPVFVHVTFIKVWYFRNRCVCVSHYPGGMVPLAVPMVMRWVPGRLRLFCPLIVRAWWPWEDEREGITGEQGKLELDRGDCTWSALACPPPMLMLLLLAPEETDVEDQRDVPAKVLLCLTIVRVPAVAALPAAPL